MRVRKPDLLLKAFAIAPIAGLLPLRARCFSEKRARNRRARFS